MFIGQILIYHYNGLANAVAEADRNIFRLKDVNEPTADLFKERILESLDEIIPGTGYLLVKWNNKLFLCEKDTNNPNVPYVRHELQWHPLQFAFSQ
jgi:hypothetical protein